MTGLHQLTDCALEAIHLVFAAILAKPIEADFERLATERIIGVWNERIEGGQIAHHVIAKGRKFGCFSARVRKLVT